MTSLPATGAAARLGALLQWLVDVPPPPKRTKPEEILYGLDERPPFGTPVSYTHLTLPTTERV